MDSKTNRSPAHFTCPRCRYELTYDHARIDDEIRTLGLEIREIMDQFTQQKVVLGEKSAEYRLWHKRAAHAMRCKQDRVAQLKAIRKAASAQAKESELQVFSQIVREHVPYETYVEWHRQAEEMMQYRTYDTAIQRHNNFTNV